MKRLLIAFLFLLSFHFSIGQNWSSVHGNNFRNGLSKITGPSLFSSPYWNINSTNPTVLGANIYTYNNRFVNSRVLFSPFYQAKIECRDVHTGALLWTSPFIGDSSILYATGFNEDAVYAHDYHSDSLYALNLVDGSIKWKAQSTSMSFTPMDGIFFTCERDLVINGPDPFTSTMRLNKNTGDTMWTNSNVISVTPSAVMAMNDSTVYRIDGTITSPKRLYAIDVNSGASKYYTGAIPGDGDQENPITIGPDGTIYFYRDGGFFYAFTDNGTGFTQLWTYAPVSLPIGYSNIAVGPDSNLLILDNGRLLRLHYATGAVLDSSAISSLPQARFAVGADSTVYVNDLDGMYYALSHDLQTVKWSQQLNNNYYAGPVLSKDGIFIVCGGGTSIMAYRDSVSLSPVTDFSADTTIVIASDSLSFTDQSSFAPTSWLWSFPGASPPTSTSQDPKNIVYSSPGTYEVMLVASNAMGSDTLIKKCYIEVIQTNSVPSVLSQEDILIYPNPAADFMIIKQSRDNIIECYDVMGHCVWKKKCMAGEERIDVNGLSEGIYLIKIFNRGSEQTKRVVILR